LLSFTVFFVFFFCSTIDMVDKVVYKETTRGLLNRFKIFYLGLPYSDIHLKKNKQNESKLRKK